MILEEKVVSGLLADPTVRGYLGTRLWPIGAPQNPGYPYALVHRISSPGNIFTMDAQGAAQGSVGFARLQITTASNVGIKQAVAIANAIAAAFQTFSCYEGPTSPPSVPRSRPNFVLNTATGRNADLQPPLFWVRQDLKVWFTEET